MKSFIKLIKYICASLLVLAIMIFVSGIDSLIEHKFGLYLIGIIIILGLATFFLDCYDKYLHS